MGAKAFDILPFECKTPGHYVLKTLARLIVVLDDNGEVIASGKSPLTFFVPRSQTVVIEKYGPLRERVLSRLWRRPEYSIKFASPA